MYLYIMYIGTCLKQRKSQTSIMLQQCTAHPADFKQNWKYFQLDLCRVREHALEVQSIICLKSQIDGHRNGQLGSLAKLAKSAKLPSWLFLWPSIQDFKQNIFGTPDACSFTQQRSRSKKFQFHLKSTQHAVHSLMIPKLA